VTTSEHHDRWDCRDSSSLHGALMQAASGGGAWASGWPPTGDAIEPAPAEADPATHRSV